MTQIQGLKAADPQAKGPNQHGIRSHLFFTVWPSSREPGKVFQQNFYFLGRGGRVGSTEPLILERHTKLYSYNQILSSKSAGKTKTTGLKAHCSLLPISPQHPWQPSHRAQSLTSRSHNRGHRMDHTSLATSAGPKIISSRTGSTWA